jgi:hypothetical protein
VANVEHEEWVAALDPFVELAGRVDSGQGETGEADVLASGPSSV